MTNPNLFKFATSELSQDAFICWLLSWADKEYKVGTDKQRALNKLAISTLTVFFAKAGITFPETIEKIEVRRQVSNIDILCIINDTFCVLIEDKVGSVAHSNQLIRYKQFMINGHKVTFSEDKIVAIYLQTHDQSNYKKVIEDGFCAVIRKDLLNIFTNDQGNAAKYSDIYADFYHHLQSIEDAVQSFKYLPIKDWSHKSWIGFFKYLQSKLGEGNWGYVANPSGGFMGFWTFFQKVDDMDVYLQLEEDKLCFKMFMTNKENRSEVRGKLNHSFVKEASNFDLQVIKPERFGSGKYMTFAVLQTDIISKQNNNPIDLLAIEELFCKLQKFLPYAVNTYKKEHSNSAINPLS